MENHLIKYYPPQGYQVVECKSMFGELHVQLEQASYPLSFIDMDALKGLNSISPTVYQPSAIAFEPTLSLIPQNSVGLSPTVLEYMEVGRVNPVFSSVIQFPDFKERYLSEQLIDDLDWSPLLSFVARVGPFIEGIYESISVESIFVLLPKRNTYLGAWKLMTRVLSEKAKTLLSLLRRECENDMFWRKPQADLGAKLPRGWISCAFGS